VARADADHAGAGAPPRAARAVAVQRQALAGDGEVERARGLLGGQQQPHLVAQHLVRRVLVQRLVVAREALPHQRLALGERERLQRVLGERVLAQVVAQRREAAVLELGHRDDDAHVVGQEAWAGQPLHRVRAAAAREFVHAVDDDDELRAALRRLAAEPCEELGEVAADAPVLEHRLAQREARVELVAEPQLHGVQVARRVVRAHHVKRGHLDAVGVGRAAAMAAMAVAGLELLLAMAAAAHCCRRGRRGAKAKAMAARAREPRAPLAMHRHEVCERRALARARVAPHGEHVRRAAPLAEVEQRRLRARARQVTFPLERHHTLPVLHALQLQLRHLRQLRELRARRREQVRRHVCHQPVEPAQPPDARLLPHLHCVRARDGTQPRLGRRVHRRVDRRVVAHDGVVLFLRAAHAVVFGVRHARLAAWRQVVEIEQPAALRRHLRAEAAVAEVHERVRPEPAAAAALPRPARPARARLPRHGVGRRGEKRVHELQRLHR